MKAAQTAVILIEFQNEFCNEEGKLHDVVKDEIYRQNTVENASKLAAAAREKGCLIIHCPFIFDAEWVDENCVSGIIGDVKQGEAFIPGSWGAEIIDEIKQHDADVVLAGKRALSAFTNTGLEQLLQQYDIKNVALSGFLSNVCVEASARSAYDLGYNVNVVKDATASGSQANQQYVEQEIYPILGGAKTVDEFIGDLV